MFVISPDSKFVHKQWNESELCKMIDGGFPFVMLSDPMGNIARSYGVYDDEDGIYLRGTVIIDPDGVVNLLSVNVHPLGRNAEEIVRDFQALKENAATGKVAPAGWKPGDKMLETTEENSGNIWKTYKK